MKRITDRLITELLYSDKRFVYDDHIVFDSWFCPKDNKKLLDVLYVLKTEGHMEVGSHVLNGLTIDEVKTIVKDELETWKKFEKVTNK